ncbi:TetR/AcrR family transcriptional regulator [Lentzea nigeriaca]|uniref:TetR/AcrR family transcriptional regulator n=1 Tax=Lentzea nigeriaca TaxID=1128665 RepID=UPI0027DD18E4|nr:helix-turn-helix domain-containing protein [Lentzea nigeriaca]MBM7856588.1 AcrR family transcriptional regulator [Lentzea nigeriaca]
MSLRADAARNRSLLLAAAIEEFALHGVDAPVSAIARRAGLGKGTVFRHFPTKDDLVAAIVLDRITRLTELATELAEADDAGAAVLEFMRFAARQRQQLDLSFLSGDLGSEVAEAQQRMARAITALVDRARAQGALRPDVTGTDVMLLMCVPQDVVKHLPDAPPELWERYLAILFDGLRPEGAHPLPGF